MFSANFSNKRLLLINTMSMVAVHLINAGTMFWVIQYLAKRVPVEDFALYAVISGVVMFAPILLDAFTNGVARYITAYYANNDLAKVSAIVTTTVVINVIAASIVSVALAVVAWNIDSLVVLDETVIGKAQTIFLLLVGGSVIYLPLAPLTAGLVAKEMFVKISLITLFASGLRTVLLVVLFISFDASVVYLALATFVSELAGYLLRVCFSIRALSSIKFDLRTLDFALGKEIIWFGSWGAVGQAATAIRSGADPIILNHLSNTNQVGTLHIAGLFDKQIRSVIGIFVAPLEPIMTKLYASGDEALLKSIFMKYSRVLLTVTLPPVFSLILFARDFMELYLGSAFDNYNDIAFVFVILLAAIPIFITLNPIVALCRAKAKIDLYVKIILFSQLSNLILTLVMVGVYEMGAAGAAVASLITTLLYPFCVWPLACKIINAEIYDYLLNIIRGVSPSVICLIVGCFIEGPAIVDGWGGLLFYMGLFVFSAYIFGFVLATSQDKDDLAKIIRRS